MKKYQFRKMFVVFMAAILISGCVRPHVTVSPSATTATLYKTAAVCPTGKLTEKAEALLSEIRKMPEAVENSDKANQKEPSPESAGQMSFPDIIPTEERSVEAGEAKIQDFEILSSASPESVRTDVTEQTVSASQALEAPDPLLHPNAEDGNSPSNPWVVRYKDEPMAAEVNRDGYVSRTYERYFGAHRWSDNGKKIAAMPEYVQTDGVLYQYDGYRIGSYLETPNFYPDWWRPFWDQDGYMAMQTCEGDNEYLVVRYRPVAGSASVCTDKPHADPMCERNTLAGEGRGEGYSESDGCHNDAAVREIVEETSEEIIEE